MNSSTLKNHEVDAASIETILRTALDSQKGLRIYIETIDGNKVDKIEVLHGELMCYKHEKDVIGFAVLCKKNKLKRSYKVTKVKDMTTFLSWANNTNLEDYSDNNNVPSTISAHFESKTLP